MKTVTLEQFKKMYGEVGVSKLSESSTPKKKSGFTSALEGTAKFVNKTINDTTEAGLNTVKEGYNDFENSNGNPIKALGGVGKSLLGAGRIAYSPLSPLMTPAGEGIQQFANQVSESKPLQKFANSPVGEATSKVVQGVSDVNELVGYVAPFAKGGGLFPQSKSPLTTNKPTIPPAAEPFRIPTQDISSGIMNRVARLKPTDMSKFEKMSGGKTPGQYLTETGNFGAPDKIITNEASKFIQSKGMVDTELSKLPGVYKDGSITDALKGLYLKAKSVSTENTPAQYLNEVRGLIEKYNSEGLSMEDINAVKRLYERNVKLGYNKLLNPDKVELATNIDNSLRKFQFQTAKDLGFENIGELNKQTQLSKFFIDKLGEQVIGQSALNSIGLTDWVVLAGGNPQAIGGFLTKKFFSSKAVQAKIAEMLNSGEKVQGLTQPKVGNTIENTIRQQFPGGDKLRLPAPTKGANPYLKQDNTTIPMRGESSIEPPAQKIFNQDMMNNQKINSSSKQVPQPKLRKGKKT